MKTHGWETFRPQLLAVMEATTVVTMERNVRLLEEICTAKSKKNDGWTEVCGTVAKQLVVAIETLDDKKTEADRRAREVERTEVLCGLVRALVASRQFELLSGFVEHTLSLPKLYSLRLVQMPAIMKVLPWLEKNLDEPCAAISAWFGACRSQLESKTAEAPAEPTDFRRPAEIGCKCKLCAELKRFLEDPREPVWRFRLNQEFRSHLEHRICGDKCDLDLVTDRKGSPHTLVCTKNKASYLEALKTYHEDQDRLESVKQGEAIISKRMDSRINQIRRSR